MALVGDKHSGLQSAMQKFAIENPSVFPIRCAAQSLQVWFWDWFPSFSGVCSCSLVICTKSTLYFAQNGANIKGVCIRFILFSVFHTPFSNVRDELSSLFLLFLMETKFFWSTVIASALPFVCKNQLPCMLLPSNFVEDPS